MNTNNKCEICENLQGLCNLHKPKETEEERAQRKLDYLSSVLRKGHGMVDEWELLMEASKKWEEANKVDECKCGNQGRGLWRKDKNTHICLDCGKEHLPHPKEVNKVCKVKCLCND